MHLEYKMEKLLMPELDENYLAMIQLAHGPQILKPLQRRHLGLWVSSTALSA